MHVCDDGFAQGDEGFFGLGFGCGQCLRRGDPLIACWWTLRVEWAERRRLRRLAARRGAEYSARDRRGLRRRHRDLAVWQYGHSHELSRILHGRIGTTDFAAMSVAYDVGFGRDWQRRAQVLVVLRVDELLPDVVMTRAMAFEPVGPHTGFREVTGDGRGDWRMFSARGENPARLRPAVRESLSGLPGPALVETQRAWVALCLPLAPRAETYDKLIEAGLTIVRSLGLINRDDLPARS